MFMPSVNNGGNEKNFFSTANNLSKNNVKVSIISCSKNKINKRINFKNDCSLVELDKLNLKIKYLVSFFLLLINSSKEISVLSFQANLFAIIASKLIGFKVYIRFNSHPEHFIKSKIKKKIFKFFYKLSNGIIVNSKEIQNTLKKDYQLSSYLVRNEIDEKKIKKLSKKKINSNFFNKKSSKILINVGRLDYNKNQEFLIKSLYKIEEKYKFNLLILGSGYKKNSLLYLIEKFKLNDRVKIINFKTNPYPFILKSDGLVLSSFYEGYPNVLIEAGILNKIIFSSDCKSGPKEILNKNKNGYLYKSNNFSSFKKVLIKYYNNSKKEVKFKKKNLWKYINFNHKRDHSNYYKNLIFKK